MNTKLTPSSINIVWSLFHGLTGSCGIRCRGRNITLLLSLGATMSWFTLATCLANDTTSDTKDPLVMKIYPDGTKVITRWSEIGKSFDQGQSHGGVPQIVAYDPNQDGIVPIGEQDRGGSVSGPMASPSSANSKPMATPSSMNSNMPKDNSFYIGLEAGGAFVQDTRLSALGYEISLNMNTGFRFDLPIGYRFNDWFSVEFAPGFIYNTIESVQSGGGIDLDGGNLVQVPLLVNFIITIPTDSPFEPYIGGGVGGLYANIDSKILNEQYDSWACGYSGLAGLNYHLDQDISFGMSYKFTGTSNQNWYPGVTTQTYTQSVEVTGTFRF